MSVRVEGVNMYLRAPGMDSRVARRRETGSGGRSRGLIEERPLKGNMEERPDMSVDKWRPALERGRVYRMGVTVWSIWSVGNRALKL